MSNYIIPIFIISIVVYSVIKRKNAYQSFVFGAKTSFEIVLIGFPYIVAIFIAIELFSASGLSTLLARGLSPVLNVVGIPSELGELILLKPFSGCGSLAMVESIFARYGVDSYLARCACCIAGSSEAIFYISAVMFSKTKVKKFAYAIPVALLANFVSAIVACAICRVL